MSSEHYTDNFVLMVLGKQGYFSGFLYLVRVEDKMLAKGDKVMRMPRESIMEHSFQNVKRDKRSADGH